MRRAVVVVATLLAALLAGCGASTTSPVPPPAETVAPGAPAAGEVRVGLTEWAINLSVGSVEAGPVQLVVTNAGGTRHDLQVAGAAGRWHTAALRPGAEETLEITATPGEVLELWCDEPGHRVQGMSTTLRVAE